MFSTRPPRHFWCKKRKSPNPTRFGYWIRTAGQNQVVTVATTLYWFWLGSSWTSRKAYKVYFHMDLDSCLYLLRGGHNRWFTTRTFFCPRCCVTWFWPDGACIKWGPTGRVLGFRDDLHHVLVILYSLNKVASKIFKMNAPDPLHWTQNSCFRYCTKVDAKLVELVPLMHKFAKQSGIWIFRNERTRSILLDPKLMFLDVSDHFVTAQKSMQNWLNWCQ
jgi:hypothetical protein